MFSPSGFFDLSSAIILVCNYKSSFLTVIVQAGFDQATCTVVSGNRYISIYRPITDTFYLSPSRMKDIFNLTF